MAKRFELVGKKKVKFTNVVVLALKRGQRELEPGATLRVKHTSDSTVLNMFGERWRVFAYKKPSAPAKQDAVPGVSAVMELTEEAAQAPVHDLTNYEQTGCTFILHLGVTKVKLTDCKMDKVQLKFNEKEVVDVTFNLGTGRLDEETLGKLAALKQHEVDVELLLPEVLQQTVEGTQLDDLTPIGALAAASTKPDVGIAAH
jgi:hypothetical protein